MLLPHEFTLGDFISSLTIENRPFKIGRDGKFQDEGQSVLHHAMYSQNPVIYALMSFTENIREGNQVWMLFQILNRVRANRFSEEEQHLFKRVISILLVVLPFEKVLAVFIALRRSRANRKRVRKTVLSYIFNHPEIRFLALQQRKTIVDCIEHAAGKNVARACAKYVKELDSGSNDKTKSNYLNRHLLCFAENHEQAKRVLGFLYQKETRPAVMPEREISSRPDYRHLFEPKIETPKTVTATNRGDIAATLVHIYRGGATSTLMEALADFVADEASTTLPFEGKLAVILDASTSTQGYGEREFCIISQSVALLQVLEVCCQNLQVYIAGGDGTPPRPMGPSDLATPLLEALESKPDLVVIISDGYENSFAGDLKDVVAYLPQADIRIPVVFCHSKFTGKDDLSLRNPLPQKLQIEFWHQNDFNSILFQLFAMAGGWYRTDWLQSVLTDRLNNIEKEIPTWMSLT